MTLLRTRTFRLERINRVDNGPPEPFRSQSVLLNAEKFHSELDLHNRPPSVHKSRSRSSTNRAKSTRPFRNSLRSVVPETTILSMAQRPDQGGLGTCTIHRKDKMHYFHCLLQLVIH